ncbi:MAG: lysine--tRNA ligase [Candidatus Odinarchaeota archaeon]|nr:lysine--tRNA ligase [Candidatus Odinarchaeota archaeon]
MENISHWLLDIVDEILKRNDEHIVINTGKTTSGRIHIGIMRELIISDALYRILKNMGKNVIFTFFIDDFDPAKHFPSYVPKEFEKYLGMPFSDIPDPYGCHRSYGEHFAMELIETFPDFGLNPKIIWTSKFYESREMKNAVRLALRNVDKIRKIYEKYVAPTLGPEQKEKYIEQLKTWMPASVVCEKCGKLQLVKERKIMPNRVQKYDPEADTVTYKCNACGYEKTDKLDNLRVKLTWRVDWPAKWSVMKVSCEPAGKDHCVKGGAYDTGLEIAKEVFGYRGPVKVPYEWIRLGERDMKTHKGIVFTPKEFLEIAWPEILRYVILRTHPMKSISVRPENLPQLIDDFERFEKIFYDEIDADDETKRLVKFLYPLVMPNENTSQRPIRLPFRFAIIMAQLESLLGEDKVLEKCVQVIKKIYKDIEIDAHSEYVLSSIKKTLHLAKNWVEQFGPEQYKIVITEDVEDIKKKLSEAQKAGLEKLLQIFKEKRLSGEEIQALIFEIGRNTEGLTVKQIFEAIYLVILNKKFGPRVGPLIEALGQEWFISRLEKILEKKG